MAKKIVNIAKGIYTWFAGFFITITIMAADTPDFGDWIIMAIISFLMGFGVYEICKNLTEEEISEMLGFTFIKKHTGIDLIGDPEEDDDYEY